MDSAAHRMPLIIGALAIATSALAGPVHHTEILPEPLPWSGASEALALPPDSADPWLTPAEASGLVESATLEEALAWIDRLAVASPEVSVVPIGESSEGRLLRMVVVARGGGARPEELARDDRVVVLAQAGIHAGEIDGKDAGLMLLRDLTLGGAAAEVLDRAIFLFVPILNIDGHERASTHGRINQRGPVTQGWRTNAANLNLNRDYTKADTPEVRAMLRVLDRWQPDLYIDLHVTDGRDYQYDVCWDAGLRRSPSLERWFAERLRPAVDRRLTEAGHLPGPLIFSLDRLDPDHGIFIWKGSSASLSDGYGDARHLPTLLVENHSLKPFRRRVLSTRVLLEAVLTTAGEHVAELRRAARADRAREPEEVVLAWSRSPHDPDRTTPYAGMAWRRETSAISGGDWVRWLPETLNGPVPAVESDRPAVTVTRPVAYWVPAAWPEVIERLHAHGIHTERVDEARTVEVEMLRVASAVMETAPREGRARVSLPEPPTVERRRVTFPAGSVRVPTDQPLGDLTITLLEPQASDSLFQWGFFLSILSRTEYAEAYVIEPMAELMLERDPELRRAFAAAKEADPELAADPDAIRDWFYRRTPYYDDRHLLYPVGREMGGDR